MRIDGEKPFPGVIERIGRAVLRQSPKSPIPKEIRSEFLGLDFRYQAELISWHARIQLRSAEKILSNSIMQAAGSQLSERDLWLRMAKKETDLEIKYADKPKNVLLTEICPELTAEAARQIFGLFKNAVSYWVDNFYSYDKKGNRNFNTYWHSKARTFSEVNMKTIDDLSKMPGLGEHIKDYADRLFDAAFYTRYIYNGGENLIDFGPKSPSIKHN